MVIRRYCWPFCFRTSMQKLQSQGGGDGHSGVRCSQPSTDHLCCWPYLDADYSEQVEQVRLFTWLL